MSTIKKINYHHGNLRSALLETAMEHLQADGLEKLSLRGLAKVIKVTPTAVYSHFTDKTDLLVSLHIIGFQRFNEYLEQTENQWREADAETRLRTLGHAYLQFATDNPHLFDMLFNWTPPFERITDECIEAGTRSEILLRQNIRQVLLEICPDPTDEQMALASFSSWSLIHGVATVIRTGNLESSVYCGNWPESFSQERPESHKQVIDHLMTIQIAGLRASLPQITDL